VRLSRQRSASEPRSRAKDARDEPLASDRLVRVEAALDEMRTTLEVQLKRITALQAQVDHLAAKVRGR
jgi:hypothetical protein